MKLDSFLVKKNKNWYAIQSHNTRVKTHFNTDRLGKVGHDIQVTIGSTVSGVAHDLSSLLESQIVSSYPDLAISWTPSTDGTSDKPLYLTVPKFELESQIDQFFLLVENAVLSKTSA